jgi:pimeloyl-ACP methyl ester carboxylesterase
MASVPIHGHDVFYREEGEGDVLVLIHGIAGCSATWDAVIPRLAAHHTVVAPDLLGHGESAKPRGDYSLGAYASGIRDLLAVLGHRRVTVVGHSLGGGVAMQFAYQFPEWCERLVLVGSGGLGKDVSPLLRALSAPGAEYLLAVLLNPRLHGVARSVGSTVGKLGIQGDRLMTELWNSYSRLTDARAQRAFFHTIRSVIDPAGQRVSARDRLYLAADMPTLIVWGEKDSVIPVAHGRAAHELMPGSRLEVFPGCGHFVPIEAPDAFVDVLEDFLGSTEPADLIHSAGWQELLTASQ